MNPLVILTGAVVAAIGLAMPDKKVEAKGGKSPDPDNSKLAKTVEKAVDKVVVNINGVGSELEKLTSSKGDKEKKPKEKTPKEKEGDKE